MLDVSCSLCYHVHTNMSCKTLQWIVLISVVVAPMGIDVLNGDSSILLSVIMIPCFIEKCNSDLCLFSNPPIIPHIILFRCQGYVIIPNHAQKRSYPQRMALPDEKTCICDCVYIIKCTVSHFKAIYGIEVCNYT